MKLTIYLLKEMIAKVLEEDLRIDKHPKADIIKKAIGDGNHLITFSDLNKVGINPTTSFNTPAGIYGWHFTAKTLQGAKKNQIFASERKFGHLLKIKNPNKVLWLGTDKTGTSAKSPAAAMELFAKAYPILNEPTIQFDPDGDIDPQWEGTDDGSRKISAAEWLTDPETIRRYAVTSDRETGGSSKSEKLYDLVMATSAVLELDQVSGKKKTITANALLRSLGIEAVVDVECGGIVHHAETCQGFFTSTAGLEHVATIENRLYSDNKLAVTRILQSPNAPEEKLWDAIRALTKDFAADIGKDGKSAGIEIDQYDALDILYDALTDDGPQDPSNKNLTSEMLAHIFKFASKRTDNNPLIAGKVMESILEHPNVPMELLRGYIDTAIKNDNSEILAAIASNPGISSEELGKIAAAGRVVDDKVQAALGRNLNTPPEVLAKIAEMFLDGSHVSASVAALGNPNTPTETINRWAGIFGKALANDADELLRRSLAALGNPSIDDEILAGLIFDENAEVKKDFKTLKHLVKLENIPPEFMDEIISFMGSANYAQSGPEGSHLGQLMANLWRNKSLTDKHIRTLFDVMPEIFDDYSYSQIFPGLLWHALYNNIASKETFTHMAKEWMKVRDKMYSDGDISRQKVEAINDAFAKKDIFVDAPSFGQQKESIQNILRRMINEEILNEAKFENEATQISREIMKRVTAHLDTNDGEPRVPHRMMANKNDLNGFNYGTYGQPDIPETLKDEGVNKLRINLGVEPSTAFADGMNFGTSGITQMGDDELGRDRRVVINVALSDAFTRKDLSQLVAQVKNTITHELTHGGQGEDILAISGNSQKEAHRLGMKTIEGLGSYYLDPAEIEAFSRGIYKQAKMTKAPFHEMLDDEIKRRLSFYAHPKQLEIVEYSEQEVRSFFEDDYRQALLDYAKKNLPAAVIEGTIKEEEDYQGGHSAPMADDGSPLWDVSAEGHYPKDVYGPNGRSWYGTGSDLDWDAYDVIRGAHGRRDKQLTIYRAVPKGLKGINRGDWVTTVRGYAKEHGESALNGEYDILKKKVTARDIFTDGNSWMEWGYDPQPRIPYSEREEWERYPGKKK